MTNKRKTTIVCIVSGVLCAVCMIAYTSSVRLSAESARKDALARYGGEQIEVCVATKDIASGQTIEATNTETRLWVADLLPEDAVRSLNDVVGKQATSSILCGEVLSNKRFQELPISLEVPAGLTAVSVPAKDVTALGGALTSGMHIDIYSTGNTSTTLLSRNVLVLATSASYNESSTTATVSWVTLAVQKNSVQEIVAASQNSTLYFTLPADSGSKDSNNSSNNSQKNNEKDKSSDEVPVPSQSADASNIKGENNE